MAVKHRLKKKASSPRRLGNAPKSVIQKKQFLRGFDDGYLRGRANYMMSRAQEPLPTRPIQVVYVTSGKGFPYGPIDQAVLETLQTMVSAVHVANPDHTVTPLVRQVMPDLVLVLDGMSLPVEEVNTIRSMGVRTAVWLTDDPYYTDMTVNIAPHYDYIFTLELNCVELYRNQGCSEVHYLPFAAYTPHYYPNTFASSARRDVSFIGSGYWNRVRFFNPVLPRLMSHNTVFNGIWWDRLPHFERYRKRIELNRWMSPEETKDVYNGTKIVLNLHRSHVDDSMNNNSLKIPPLSPNPRTFEISACATLQLTDVRSDLSRFYTPGVEIETFETHSDMIDKIEYYLANEDKRQEIALRGFERTWNEHTYAHRLNSLLQIIFG
ncbi:glycosyltransferase [Neobacillus mesonae]|nr:glycosyltransferase [Neobacillus mesonae]